MGMGKQIEKLLDEINMNVNELSSKIGVRPQRIYNIIARDTKKVDKELIGKIAKVLGVPIDYFNTDKSLDSYTRTEQKMIDGIAIAGIAAKTINNEVHRKQVEEELKRRRETYDGGSRILIMYFNQLNKEGKKELVRRAAELTRLEEYTSNFDDLKSD